MKIRHDYPYPIRDYPLESIVLQDGTRLAARIWRPDVSESVPAILEYIPYRKRDGTIARDMRIHPYLAGHGYAMARVDLRGSGDSSGVMLDEYTEQELQDGVEVIEWLAVQPWCNGDVGMMGKSWGAFNSVQIAALAPRPLKAVVAVCGTVDRYADDIHYKGGCLLNDNLRWGNVMLAYSARPPDPLVVGEEWRDLWRARLEAEPFFSTIWQAHPHRDAYWKHGSVCEDYRAIKAAVLVVGGWADGYINALPHLMSNLETPIKAIAGPWGHQYPHLAAPGPQIGFLQEMLRWWDHWLKGVDNGVADDPLYRYWLSDSTAPARSYSQRSGRWRVEPHYPSHRWMKKHLHFGARHQLQEEPETVMYTVSSPAHCGLEVGEYFPMAQAGQDLPELAGDQRTDDALSLTFDSDVLSTHWDLVGRACVGLRLSVDSTQAQIAVRLGDVHPDGAVSKICHGFLNLAYREGFETPYPLTPGQEYDVRILFDEVAYRLPPGHRLRLSISTQYWPFLWPLPHPATLSVHRGSLEFFLGSGSEDDEWHFAEAESSPPWRATTHREGSYNRTLHTDYASGEVCLTISSDDGCFEDAEHGLIHDSQHSEIWRIHPDDPLCASAEILWQQSFAREDWSVEIITRSTMSADAEKYTLEARLEAYDGKELFFEKDFHHTQSRDYH